MHKIATMVSTKSVSPTYTACCTDKLVLEPVYFKIVDVK